MSITERKPSRHLQPYERKHDQEKVWAKCVGGGVCSGLHEARWSGQNQGQVGDRSCDRDTGGQSAE